MAKSRIGPDSEEVIGVHESSIEPLHSKGCHFVLGMSWVSEPSKVDMPSLQVVRPAAGLGNAADSLVNVGSTLFARNSMCFGGPTANSQSVLRRA